VFPNRYKSELFTAVTRNFVWTVLKDRVGKPLNRGISER
jgi:hypothetical protein